MKESWVLRYEVVPGNGEKYIKYATWEAALKNARQKIAEEITAEDLEPYFAQIDSRASAYIRNYLTDPSFPYSEDDIPEDYEEPEDGELTIEENYFEWEHPYGACPHIAGLLMHEGDAAVYDFDYEYEGKFTGRGIKAMTIRIDKRVCYGTGSYPLLVWKALGKKPKKQADIIAHIQKFTEIKINRKAVGVHLKLLKQLGFPIKHNQDGYYSEGAYQEADPDLKITRNAYPLLILQVLDKTPRNLVEIIQTVKEKYGVEIERKAVARHVQMMEAMFSDVKKAGSRYYIG